MTLTIRELQTQDIAPIAQAFAQLGWNKPAIQYERYLAEQNHRQRDVLVAFVNQIFAGYVTIVWTSDYAPFREAGIPEIVDFNVLPHYRRRHIGTQLMDEAEARIAQRAQANQHPPVAGIGVGMYADYGAAQRMYVLRGYVPDARGLAYDIRPVQYGEQITVDDSLALYFTKQLG